MIPTANFEDAVILLIRTAALARWPAEVRRLREEVNRQKDVIDGLTIGFKYNEGDPK